jgi:uncharacterized protein with HEPN domain
MPSRDWRFRLADIRDALLQIRAYTAGLTADEFVADARTVDAVVFRFIVVGEAARAIPERELARMPGIPWAQIGAFRNLLVHEYFGVRVETVWQTVVEDLPALLEAIEALPEEKGDPGRG